MTPGFLKPQYLWSRLTSTLCLLFRFIRPTPPPKKVPHTPKGLYRSPNIVVGLSRNDLVPIAESAYSSVWVDQAPRPLITIKQCRLPKDHPESFKQSLEDAAYQWKRATHLPNVQEFLGLWDWTHHPSFVAAYTGPNLMDYLESTPTADVQKFIILHDIAGALDKLHNQNPPILHTNVKGSNILIDEKGKAFLTDIGVHDAISREGQVDACIRWRAPEKILGMARSHTKECDIWSFGMTVLEVFTQRLPYFEILHDWHIPLIVEQNPGIPARPSEFSDTLWRLLLDCWSYQPSERLEIKLIMIRLRLMSESARMLGSQ